MAVLSTSAKSYLPLFLPEPFGGNESLYRGIRYTLLVLCAALMVILLLNARTIQIGFSAACVALFSLLPTYMWLSLPQKGFPIFPLFALPHLWAFAFPVIVEHPKIRLYTEAEISFACLTVSFFLLASTVVWWFLSSASVPKPKRCLCLRAARFDSFLLWTFFFGVAFCLAIRSGHISLPPELFSLFRAINYNFTILCIFTLGYLFGNRRLGQFKGILFLLLLVLNCYLKASSLLLAYALSDMALAIVAITIARKRFPWLLGTLGIVLLVVLHFGKSDMRDKYWKDGARGEAIELAEIPGRILEWYTLSFDYVLQGKFSSSPAALEKYRERRSVFERVSLLHMLLLTQRRAGDSIPFLYGETYWPIPYQLIPRILHKEKMASHFSTYRLNLLYDLQKSSTLGKTTIAWGLLPESWANFGLYGVGAIATVLGVFFAWLTRLTVHPPLVSLRTLIVILAIPIALRSEMTLSVAVTALFQGIIPLLMISFFYMKSFTLEKSGSNS